jgi:carboxyl-terminal processing protease
MFFQRRRLQVLLSLLVIVVALLYLGGQLLGEAPDLEPRRQDSQLSEAFFLLRTSYVHKLEETPLLEGAVAGLLEEVARRQLDSSKLPRWSPLPSVAGEASLLRVESFLERVASLDSQAFPRQEVIYSALRGMTDTLGDPYTLAMDPATFARFQGGLHSHVVGGVGLEVEWTHGAYVVFEVQSGSPAALAGIRPGDHLLAVAGVPLFGPDQETEPLENVRYLLSGEVGSSVTLSLTRGGAPFSRTLTRATFKTRSVRGRMIGDQQLDQPRLGWLAVESLGESTGHEMADAVARLQTEGAVGYVLDLRDNVGGYLNAAVEVASLFLPSGQPVVVVRGRNGESARQTIGARPIEATLLVLVNGRTASSAEILAGALQDYQRATLLGSQTFGKGSVQSVHDFADGGGFKMTTATYLTPRKRVLEGKGLLPDLEVDVTATRDQEQLQQEILEIFISKAWTTTARTSNF